MTKCRHCVIQKHVIWYSSCITVYGMQIAIILIGGYKYDTMNIYKENNGIKQIQRTDKNADARKRSCNFQI